EITALSFPGEIFSGLVAFIDPYLNEKTRTVKVRINVKNDNLRLKPGMYVNARLTSSLSDFGLPIDRTLYGKYLCPMHPDVVQQNMGTCSKCGMELEKHEIPDDKKIGVRTRVVYVCPMEEDKDVIKERPGECPKCGMKLIPKEIKRSDERVLGVPKRAVLDTGQRQLVYVEKEVGTYIAREIRIGPEAMAYVDGEKMVFFPILDGLSEGERVVVRGNFLIDSQTQITGAAEAIYGGALGKDNTAMPSGHQH
ncbi:MAG: heavy metal-binding domain-containing protein, partial [Thermodesulfobacteriota bacterium]|nr:heavy metal-binding domain-containing protein [Thermodesulfobacteriota bacterium]